MNLSSNSPIKQQGRGLLSALAAQRGAFSPFMYGLIIGVTIFSAVSMQYAKQELARMQREKTEHAKADAEDVAKAMDFAILSETKSTYRDDYTLQRARQYSQSSGKTMGDEDFQLNERDSDRESYGQTSRKIAITASDDTFQRGRVAGSATADELDKIAGKQDAPVAVYDTSDARARQVLTSSSRMESLAEQVYAYYAANMKFPDENDFHKLNQSLGLTDAWGEEFTYEVAPDRQTAKLAFTTPWNYQRTLNLSLKDNTESSK